VFVQLVVATGNRTGQIVPVSGDKFIIGRAEDCHLRSRSELISRYHCAILLVGNKVVVRDLGSKNGVRLNGTKVNAEHKLENGDKLVIGPLEFFVHIAADCEASIENQIDAGANRLRRAEDSAGEQSDIVFNSTILLNRLETLNRETRAKPEQSEQSVHDLLKKFL